MKTKIPGSEVYLEIIKGDITSQDDVEAVVNAANAQLLPGGGVDGAIHRVAGPDLRKEAEKLAPIVPGQAVITSAYNLPNNYVIHCLGPVYGIDKPEDKLLKDCYKNALNLCEQNQIGSIAFPAISTGAFGFPIKEASEISLKFIKEKAPESKSVKLIRFVLFSEKDFNVYKNVVEEIIG